MAEHGYAKQPRIAYKIFLYSLVSNNWESLTPCRELIHEFETRVDAVS